MGMTVAEMSARLSAREYREWVELDAIEPLGWRRADYHAANVAMWAAAPHIKRETVLSDFLPFREDRFEPAQGAPDSVAGWVAAARGHGLKVERRDADASGDQGSGGSGAPAA